MVEVGFGFLLDVGRIRWFWFIYGRSCSCREQLDARVGDR